MKKYQRLLLIIISIISVSLFLVYRHQYNRLHRVLEVFNFFGTPCNFSELQQSEHDLAEHDWGPQPLWQEIDSKAYVYSAFLVDKSKVQGVGVAHSNSVIPKSCVLNFENQRRPSKGKLTIAKTEEDKFTGFFIYRYTCTFSNTDKIPFSITFKSQGERKYVDILISNTLDKKISLNVTICVIPSNFSKKSLLEFLSFHSLLGVDSFIVYFEQNVPYKLIKLLKNLSRTLNMWTSFLPFNLPLSVPNSFTNGLVEYDCQLRAKAHSKYSIVLDKNEYIVPSLGAHSGNTRLAIKKFCLNHVTPNRPMILQNFEAVDDYNFNDIKNLNINNASMNPLRKIPNVFDTVCVIHRYKKCEKGLKTKADFSVKRFSTDFTRSTLVQMLIHEEVGT